MTAVGLDRATAEAAVAVAVRAPSIHNTQPWAWRLSADGLALRADRSRQLSVADPDLLAIFRPLGRADADEQTLLEIDAALSRRSDRRPFALHEVPASTADELHEAGSNPQARVDFPTRSDERVDLAVAVSWADRVERDDQAYIEEQNRWVRDPEVHALVDGVPVDAIPHVPAGSPRRTDVPLRDFEAGMTGRQLIARDVDEKPLIAVVLTDFDNAADHLAAGQAMMRLMIAAQLRGLSTCPLSQAVDFAEFRTRVQRVMGWVGYPQMMLRVGYPGGPASDLIRTPRRGVEAVLDVVD